MCDSRESTLLHLTNSDISLNSVVAHLVFHFEAVLHDRDHRRIYNKSAISRCVQGRSPRIVCELSHIETRDVSLSGMLSAVQLSRAQILAQVLPDRISASRTSPRRSLWPLSFSKIGSLVHAQLPNVPHLVTHVWVCMLSVLANGFLVREWIV